MGQFNRLKKRYINNVMGDDPRFGFSREFQEKVINKYNVASEDLIERSYYQYKCQRSLLGKKVILYHLAAFFLIVQKIIFTKKKVEVKENADLVCCLAGIDKDMVPEELQKKYDTVYFYFADGGERLTFEDLKWFFQNIVHRYPFDFFYHLKIISRLCSYSYIMGSFKPKAIANHCEYSCGASAMTEYCHYNGMIHINFMHGEKIWCIRDSFFRFDECYVWSEHYINLFINLKAYEKQFIVSIPPKFLIASNENFDLPKNVEISDYCYYLANETKEQLDNIFSYLSLLCNSGKICRVRLHPRWGDHIYVKMLANKYKIKIEDESVDINVSILTTKNAISLFSTVLFQSHLLNIPIVIDDLSSGKRFRSLQDLNYIAFSLPHHLMSTIIDSPNK